MFWGDRLADEIEKTYAPQIKAGTPLVIRDEKTPSGRVHVGSMRGVAVHGTISEILAERGIAHTFLYEINDMDPMDGLPNYLDEEKFRPYMGLPLFQVPSPEGNAASFADYFGRDFEEVITATGFAPTFYRGSEVYLSGKMDGVVRTALERADLIRDIYKRISGSERKPGWLPLSVVCEKCGKEGTTKATDFDGETVAYTCEPKAVEWAEGCGHRGRISPFGGRAKLPWKVEWAAKFVVHGVHVEGAGKDHSTKGGSRDVANAISREVFEHEPPFDVPYEFFLVGGQKMSSSKGQGSSAREISELMPPHIFRLSLLLKDIKQAFNFDPQGDTIPVLFDTYDRFATLYDSGVRDDFTRVYELSHPASMRGAIPTRFLPRFSQVAYLVQMPHLNLGEQVTAMKGEELTESDLLEMEMRARYARIWIERYAPEQFRFELQKETPASAHSLTEKQKEALQLLLNYMETHEPTGEELHAELHAIKEKAEIQPAELFKAIYRAFLDKESGPKAGWFLSVLPRELVLRRLKEITA